MEDTTNKMDGDHNQPTKKKQSLYKFTLTCEFMKNLCTINLMIRATCINSNGNNVSGDKILYSFPASLQQERGRLRVVIASSLLTFRPFTKEIQLPSKHILLSVRDARCTAQNNQSNNVSFTIPYKFTNDEQKLNYLMERDDSTAATNEHQVAVLRQILKDQQQEKKENDGNHSGLNIMCRTCNSTLTNSINIVKCLPSSNWTEIMDVWLCGCTGVYEFANLPNATQDIQSISNQCLLGDQYLLINDNNIIVDSITKSTSNNYNPNKHQFHQHQQQQQQQHPNYNTNYTNNHDDKTVIDINLLLKSLDLWQPFECSFCQQDLGVYYQNNYRLYKHSVALYPSTPNNNNNTVPKNLFDKHTIATLFSTYLLTQSQSSTIYKFLLQSSTTHQVFAQITLLSWDSLLLIEEDFTNKQFESIINDDQHNYQPIVKVMYKLLTGQEETPSPSPSPMNDLSKCKLITLSSHECFAILQQLETSHQSLPFFTKTIEGSKIGILPCL